MFKKILQWLGLAPTLKDEKIKAMVMGSLEANKKYEPPKKEQRIQSYVQKPKVDNVNSSGSVYSTPRASHVSSTSDKKKDDDNFSAADVVTAGLYGYAGGLANSAILSSASSYTSSSNSSDSCYSSSDSYSSCDSGSSSSWD